MRSPFALLLFTGLVSSGVALLPVLSREMAPGSVRESLEAVLSQPIQPVRSSLVDSEDSGSSINQTVVPASADDTVSKGSVPPTSVIAPPPVPQPAVVSVSTGEASWYGPGFYGNRTANGEVYRPGTMTAAHRTLPFGTKVRVTNLWNGRIAVIRINDRGPFVGHRVIDLGHGAASRLGLTASGIAQVKLEVLR